MCDKGYVHLYTGKGKGKSTAAFGLALRARGAGLSVAIIQFMKGGIYSEHDSFRTLGIVAEKFGSADFYHPGSSSYIEHRGYAKKGLECAAKYASGGEFALVILDEIIGAHNFNLVTYEEIVSLIENKNPQTELVLTGRDAPSDLFERCDLVTEMNEIKHYFNEGVVARKGIEL